MSLERVLDLIREERARQEENYGHVNDSLVNGTGPETRWLLPYSKDPATLIESELRDDYDGFEDEAGLPTWCHILREEFAEVAMEDDEFRLAEELVQVASVAASWVERLRKDPTKWKWAVYSREGGVVHDSDWGSAADVMAGTNGFGAGPWQVVVKRPGDTDWSNFWAPAKEN